MNVALWVKRMHVLVYRDIPLKALFVSPGRPGHSNAYFTSMESTGCQVFLFFLFFQQFLFFEKFLFFLFLWFFRFAARFFAANPQISLRRSRESAFRAPFHLNDLFKGKKLII